VIRVRRHRQLFATFVAALLLYAQLAVAAYACPGVQVPPAAASMVDCDSHPHGGMDPDQPQLCQAHCDPGEQSPNSGAGGLLTAGAAALPVLLWVLPQADVPAGIEASAYAPANGPPRGGPPLYLSLLVLRN
jgi:hypothetical protein